MENGYSTRYSLGVTSPSYQSTPMVRKSQNYNYGNRSQHSNGSGELKTPSSTLQMNGDAFDYEGISAKLNGTNSFGNTSPSPVSKLAEMDSSTIMRQRKELQLMITELKERDKELNELVQSHHKQLVSWEVDRERLSVVTKQMEKVKTEYRKRHEQCKLLKDKLRKYEGVIEVKNKEVVCLKTNLQHVQDRDNSSANHIEEQEQKIRSLQSSVEELSNNVGTLRAHEQQLETLLRLRENDLKDANTRIAEITEKLKISNNNANEFKRHETDSKFELVKARSECAAAKEEMEKLKASYQESVELESQEEISRLKQEVICLQKELMLASEREKRKDSLLELGRSKQERTEVELTNLRLIYNTLQSDAIMTKQQWLADDDKLSVFSMSEYGDKDGGLPIVLNSTILLESPHSSLLASTEGYEMKKFSPISGGASNASHHTHSLLSPAHNEDAGTMSTGELRPTDLSSNYEENLVAANNSNHNTPAVRLEKLLNESKQMVDDVATSSAHVSRNILERGEEAHVSRNIVERGEAPSNEEEVTPLLSTTKSSSHGEEENNVNPENENTRSN